MPKQQTHELVTGLVVLVIIVGGFALFQSTLTGNGGLLGGQKTNNPLDPKTYEIHKTIALPSDLNPLRVKFGSDDRLAASTYEITETSPPPCDWKFQSTLDSYRKDHPDDFKNLFNIDDYIRIKDALEKKRCLIIDHLAIPCDRTDTFGVLSEATGISTSILKSTAAAADAAYFAAGGSAAIPLGSRCTLYIQQGLDLMHRGATTWGAFVNIKI